MPRALDVWCFDRLAGQLRDEPGGMSFAYDPAWVADRQPPLSQSLPLDGAFDPAAADAFFGGLLPEGQPRTVLGQRLGVDRGNDFGLLAALGGDTAGAISLLPPGERQRDGDLGDVDWLDDDGVARLIEELPDRPMHADEDGNYRLSLAGAQDKLPVMVAADGRIGLTTGRTPSTHILKIPIAGLDDTVANEAMALAVGRHLGVRAVSAIPHRGPGYECLLVARYDRRPERDGEHRLHQEDFCQALAIPTKDKYESDGGPSLADCFALVRRATDVPARDVLRLLDHVVLSFLVGNNDAHGKNYSLLYLPDVAGAELAPAYDVLSSVVYRGGRRELSRRMAMKLGGENRPEYVRTRHFERLFADAGLGPAAARRRLLALAQGAPIAAATAREEIAQAGWDVPVLDRIEQLVAQRAQLLFEIARGDAV
jgi:serine/threonine-protein kinase HipA